VDDASKSDCGFIGIDQVRGGRVGVWGCGGRGWRHGMAGMSGPETLVGV